MCKHTPSPTSVNIRFDYTLRTNLLHFLFASESVACDRAPGYTYNMYEQDIGMECEKINAKKQWRK